MESELSEPEPVYTPGAVTPGWLGEVLRYAGVIDRDSEVVRIASEEIGTGQVGSNVRFRLSYASGDVGPTSVVAKFAASDETSRAAGIATRTYETEVAFYRDLAHTVEVSRPACYLADITPGTADVVLVLEDVAPATQGDQIAGCDVDQAGLAMDQAARLHGPRWGDTTLEDHDWLAAGVVDGSSIADLYNFTWATFVERYEARLEPQALDVGRLLRERMGPYAARRPDTLTLTHGDYRLDNMLFSSAPPGSAPPLVVVDWQTVRLGCGTADVAYFLGAGLDVATRRAHEHDLVGRYHHALGSYAVHYSFDECWDDYRRYSYGGYVMAVIASVLVGRTERGDDMFMAMANRHATQAVDLDAEELIP